MKSFRPTGSVRISLVEVKDSAKRNSCHVTIARRAGGAVHEAPVDPGLLQRGLLERGPELDRERAVEGQLAHVARGGVENALGGEFREVLQIGERLDGRGRVQRAGAVLGQHRAAIGEDEGIDDDDRVLAAMAEQAHPELPVAGQRLGARAQPLEGGQALGIDAGGLEQIGVLEAELPDIDVEGDAVEAALVDGRIPGAGEDPVAGDPSLPGHSGELGHRAGFGEGADPDLVERCRQASRARGRLRTSGRPSRPQSGPRRRPLAATGGRPARRRRR